MCPRTNEKQTVVPGFDYKDHDFLVAENLKSWVSPELFQQLQWLVRKG
jgi:predicted cupin superfamily sugar epimerase